MTSLIEVLAQRAAETPERPAILAPSGRSTAYAELHAQVVRLREQLSAAAITADCAVALALPNGPELAVAFLGTMTAAAGAPLAAERPVAEHERDLAAMGASLLVVQHGHDTPARAAAAALGIPLLEIDPETREGVLTADPRPRPSPAAGAAPDDDRVALLLFTSGTTSRPKLVPSSEASLLRSAANVAAVLDLTADDRCLNVMPLFHVHGIVAALLASITTGGSVVCAPGFLASQAWDWIDDAAADLVHRRADHPPGDARREQTPGRSHPDSLDAAVRAVVVGRAPGTGDGRARGCARRTRHRGVRHDRGRAPDREQPAPAGFPQARHGREADRVRGRRARRRRQRAPDGFGG